MISTLTFGPLLAWILWPRFDPRLEWHPLVGTISALALALSWAYSGHWGLTHKRWPVYVSVLTVFNAAFAVTTRSNDIAAFTAASVAGGGFACGILGGLIVIVAIYLNRARHYGDLEDTLLLIAPLVEAAMIAGITAGAMVTYPGWPFTGLAAGLAAGTFVSFFVLSWVYGVMNTVATLIVDRRERRGPVSLQKAR